MMYRMKKIIVHDKEILLPDCMYSVKYRTDYFKEDDRDINISNQGSNKMSELEERQEQLLKKLDTLYDRIKTISSYCKVGNIQDVKPSNPGKCLPAPEEVVLILSPDSLPWYLNVILKKSSVALNILWHIHSTVPNEKLPKIKNYLKNLQESKNNPKINLRLIFKCGKCSAHISSMLYDDRVCYLMFLSANDYGQSDGKCTLLPIDTYNTRGIAVLADTELKLSTLDTPIVGNVNILRYLSYVYPSVVPYNPNDHHVDYLLDLCHVLERTSDKNKEVVVMKLFSHYKNWIYGDEFSIVDLAAFNVIKQWKNVPKYVPKAWFEKCDKLVQ